MKDTTDLADDAPHWEHGYRCHGYWLGLERVGFIGLPPPGYPTTYSWSVGIKRTTGEEATLRAAKRAVEVAYRAMQKASIA